MSALKPLLAALLAIVVTAHIGDAAAQAKFPNRPIRILNPFAPGGGLDVVARIVGQRLTEQTGQPVVVESKPGAGGVIAINELMRSDPDGTTLLMTTNSHATLPALNKLPWHPSNDFTPIASIYSTMFVMATNAASLSRFRTIVEFLAYVRANPNQINWGSSGTAGPQHLAGMQFVRIAGVDMVHVPYRGNGPMIQALLANDVQLVFDTPTLSVPHIQDGKLAALAVTGDHRMAKLPDAPTVKEATQLDYLTDIRIFVLGPKGIPAPIQSALNKEFVMALDDGAVRQRLTGLGLEVPASRDNTVAHLKTYIDGFAATYGKLITELGIKAE